MDHQSFDNTIPTEANKTDQQFKSLLGQVVLTEEDAYDLYNNYANFEVGFGIRVNKTRYCLKTQKIRQKDYVCCCEGFKRDKKSGEELPVSRLNVRIGCPAMVRFTIQENGEWVVTHHITEHNHYLAEPHERHLIKSARKVTQEKALIIQNLVNAGSKITHAYEFLASDVHGEENLGFTKKDCYNHLHQVALKIMEVGDAQSLIDYFRSKEEEDPMFYYSFQLDKEGRLTNIFWRDGRCRIDYEAFGDVVIYDNTYRTNKYDMICAPFVGVNHHGKNVMFGCAFLLDEKTESFTWLFRNFLHSMGGKAPKTIYTDQDQAMSNAIREIFPESRHRLCQWHIWKKVGSYLGPLSKNGEFMSRFYSCFHGVESSEEFERTWEDMIVDFQCKENNWLCGLYTLRHKWSSGLNNDVFSAGILSTQRSESTNHVLNEISTTTTCLTIWVQRFENLVKGWRKKESDEDFRCKQGTPYCEISNRMIKHAGRVYTISSFAKFKAQYLLMLETTWKEVYNDVSTVIYEVRAEEMDKNEQRAMMSKKRENESKGDNIKVRIVTFKKTEATVSCSCKMFEVEGILCRHALKILALQNFTEVPNDYILKRWTKEAKRMEFFPMPKETPLQSNIVFSSSRFRSAYNIILAASEYEATKAIWDDGFKKIMADIEKELGNMKIVEDHLKKNTPVEKDSYEGGASEHEVQIKNPNKSRTKGAPRTRLKSSQEKKKASTKKAKHVSVHEIPPDAPRAEQINLISAPQQPLVIPNQGFHMYPTSYYGTGYNGYGTRYDGHTPMMHPESGMPYTSMLQGSHQYQTFQMSQEAPYYGLNPNSGKN